MKEWLPTKIPKIAHFYWGNSTLPFLRYLTLKTFSHYNPDWQLILYIPIKTDSQITWDTPENKTNFNGIDYTYKLEEMSNLNIVKIDFYKYLQISNDTSDVHKSDFLRWKLLSEQGGMWIDMDIIFIKPIAESECNINKNTNLIFCQCRYGHSIGFIGSSADNAYYKHINKMAREKYNKRSYQSIGCELINGSDIFGIMHKYNYKGQFIAPETVYPLDAIRIRHIYNGDFPLDDPRTIGLHWFGGDSMAFPYVNAINEDNYKDYKNNTTGEVYQINTLLSTLKRIEI